MTKEWSEEGLDFEAEMPIKELQKYGIQKVVDKKQPMTDDYQEEDFDD